MENFPLSPKHVSFNRSVLKAGILTVLILLLRTFSSQAQYNNFDWGTYFDSDYDASTGFTDEELVDGVVVDTHSSPESIYIVGRTKSIGTYTDTVCGSNTFEYGLGDAFLAKYTTNSKGECGSLEWVQYLGNPHGGDYGYSIALDYNADLNKTFVYIGGDTKTGHNEDSVYNAFACSSEGCPNDVFQKYRRDEWEGWIAKYDDGGTLLRYTFLGGFHNDSELSIDQVLSMTVDPVSHDLLVTGYTESLNIGVGAVNTYDKKYNGKGDGFIAVLDPCLTTLKFFTYYDINTADTLVPKFQDRCHSIVMDSHRNIYLSGTTESPGGIATPGVCGPIYRGSTEGFISKWAYGLGTNGIVKYTPVWGSYLAGKSSDRGRGLAIDDAGNSFITGWTASKTFPVSNLAFQKVQAGGNDAFVTKFDSTGHCQWSTLFGGSKDELDNAILWRKNPNDATDKTVYIIGLTNSLNLPLANPLVSYLNGNSSGTNPKYDVFIAGLEDVKNLSDTQHLKFSTYLGGTRDETNQQALSYGPSMAFGTHYELYFTFSTKSNDVGTISNADKIVVGYHTGSAINTDAFLGKLINTNDPSMVNCNSFPAKANGSGENEFINGSMRYYPNPIADQLHIKLESDIAGTAQLDIMDVLGRKIETQSIEINAGTNEFDINFSQMTPGMYLLHTQLGDQSYTVSLIKQ